MAFLQSLLFPQPHTARNEQSQDLLMPKLESCSPSQATSGSCLQQQSYSQKQSHRWDWGSEA